MPHAVYLARAANCSCGQLSCSAPTSSNRKRRRFIAYSILSHSEPNHQRTIVHDMMLSDVAEATAALHPSTYRTSQLFAPLIPQALQRLRCGITVTAARCMLQPFADSTLRAQLATGAVAGRRSNLQHCNLARRRMQQHGHPAGRAAPCTMTICLRILQLKCFLDAAPPRLQLALACSQPSMRRHPSPAARPTNTAGTRGTATPTPATGRGGYLSGIKAAAASVAAVSTFAIASKALARAAPPGQSPIDLDLLASPSSRTSAPQPGKTAPLTPRLSSPSSSSAKIATSTRSNSSALDQTSSAARSTRQEEQPWAIRRKTLRAALQPTPSSAAPFFEAIGCKDGAIGIIRLPRNAAALIYPASSGSSRSPRPLSSNNCDFFICARDDQSRTEWQVALQLQLEGASCSDALSAHSDNTRALHAVRELEEAVHGRDILTQDLAACEKELLELKTAAAAAHQREAAALASNATLTQRVAKLECEVRLSENQQHEMRGRLAQVAVTADAEHGRLAAAECALREQNTAQLKRIAVLEERVEASQRLQAERHRALEQLSAAEAQLHALQQEKREAVRELHSRIEKCKSLERQLSMAKEASAADEKEMFSSRAAAARALDEAAACRLKCNELDGASWSSKDKLLKAQEALVSLRKRADAAEQSGERYERQLDETKQKEKQTRAQVALLEKENRELKMDVQSLAAEKQVMRLELLQSSLENDKVRLGASSFACTPQPPAPAPLLSGCFSALMPPQVSAMRATIKSLEQDKAALIARERRSRTGSASGDR